MIRRLRSIGKTLKHELYVYRLILKDSRTPWLSRALLYAAIGYTFLPFDLIPDFIPVLGHVDDLIIVPGLVLMALALVPKEVIDECRKAVSLNA